MTIQEILNDILVSDEYYNIHDLNNYILECFGDYTFEGESDVITTIENNRVQAYIDCKNAPIIVLLLEDIEGDNEKEYKIIDGYIYN